MEDMGYLKFHHSMHDYYYYYCYYYYFAGPGAAACQPLPNFGHLAVANGALLKLVQVLIAEHKDKPVRINEVCTYLNF